MTQDIARKIRLLGATRSYTDGAEDTVCSVLESAEDRSDGSDELYSHAVDWGTTYHLSPNRSNLLRPFEIGAEHRVLEIGAGTGALTRHLGESGASVVALEGDAIRAKAISLRCSDLDNVEVVCGALNDFEDPTGFDLVIVIGVLEYAGGATVDDRDQLEFLRHAVSLLKPEGALVLAIENQLGLKYLLGYGEDHLEEPWAGIEGYPGDPPIRTFSRSTLRSLLHKSGVPVQRWLYPYPDYKLPQTILTEELFDHSKAIDIVDQLVGSPVHDLASPSTRFCDDRSSHLVFLEAGLGTEVANSFLVVAARDESALGRFIQENVLAWHYSGERQRCWRRSLEVRHTEDGLSLSSFPVYPDEEIPETTWLEHAPDNDEVFFIGRTLEQDALRDCRRHDVDGLSKTLRTWHEYLVRHEQPAGSTHGRPHPFLASTDRNVLPPEFLDVNLSNFVDTGDFIAFVDREWRAGTSVDAELVRFRALWYFALGLVTSGVGQPFEPNATVNAIAVLLWELIGLEPKLNLIEELFPAEALLQELVTGEDPTSVEEVLHELGSLARADKRAASTLPVARIRRDTVRLGEMLENTKAQIEDARQYQLSLEDELDRTRLRAAELENHLSKKDDWVADLESSVSANETLQKEISDELNRGAQWARTLDSELEQSKQRADLLEKTIVENETLQKDISDELNRGAQWAQILDSELEQSKQRADLLEKTIVEKDQWNSHLESSLAEIAHELDRTGSWAKDLESQLRQTVRIVTGHGHEMEKANSENRVLLEKVQDLEARRAMVEDELDRVTSQARKLEDDVTEKTEKLAAVEDQLKTTSRDLRSIEIWRERVTDLRLVRAALAIHKLIGGPGKGV